MDDAGHLCVTAKQSAEGKRSIPIDFKPASATAAATTDAGQKTK